MRPLTLDDLVDLRTYESCRDAYRARIMAHKRERRVGVGDRVTLLFEDRETLRYQVLEMARVERIASASGLQHELDVYNDLVPGEGELSATLFIEIPDLESIRPELDRLVGLDEHVAMVLGEDADERVFRARFDAGQMEEDRISAVHYLRFELGAEGARLLADDRVRARLRIDHPGYRHEAEISPLLRASLLRDLHDRVPVLLEPGELPPAAPAPADELVRETDGLRVVRPGAPRAPDHLVIEPTTGLASLLEATPEQLAELMGEARRQAADIVKRRGRARVAIDVDPSVPGARLRIHVVGVEGD